MRFTNCPPALLSREERGGWGKVRWGMSVEEVLAAYPDRAQRVDPEEKLADGTVIAARLEEQAIGARTFRIRFLFEGGKLALVSARTPQDVYAPAESYDELQGLFRRELGPPAAVDADDALIDMRQTRWVVGRTAVDLKYIPGVLAVVYHPTTAQPRR
ncbi:MAG: hypothetical protein ACJ79E_14345 [Anaeromyxobacteraceae bacterium]